MSDNTLAIITIVLAMVAMLGFGMYCHHQRSEAIRLGHLFRSRTVTDVIFHYCATEPEFAVAMPTWHELMYNDQYAHLYTMQDFITYFDNHWRPVGCE